jgi:hypothetical protein
MRAACELFRVLHIRMHVTGPLFTAKWEVLSPAADVINKVYAHNSIVSFCHILSLIRVHENSPIIIFLRETMQQQGEQTKLDCGMPIQRPQT